MIPCVLKIHLKKFLPNFLEEAQWYEALSSLIPLPYLTLYTMALGDDWPDLLTVREVAKILRVSPLTIKRWGKRGKLPAIRINSRGDRRYKKEAVMWLLGLQQKGA